jgi:RHS repeat-associated protein
LVDSALYATGDTLSNVVVTSSASGAAKVQWLVPDHLGTPRIILDQTGNLGNVKRHDYLPFGEELFAGTGGRTILQGYSGGDGVRQQFTQKERDIETGLDYFLARYYSSTQGRFTSPDEFTGGPVELFDFSADAADNPTFYADLSQPQSLNKYHYCLNNPLNYVDPNGHQQALTQRIMWEQGYFQRLAAPIGAAVDKAVDKVSHPFRTAGEVRERVQKALGTDRESLIKSNMEDGFSREQAEMLADKAIAFNDSVLMGPTQGLKFEQSAERGLVSQGYKVTRGDDIAEGMADILAVASDKRSGIVREVTTSASKSISQIRKQLQNGFGLYD